MWPNVEYLKYATHCNAYGTGASAHGERWLTGRADPGPVHAGSVRAESRQRLMGPHAFLCYCSNTCGSPAREPHVCVCV